MKFSKAEEQILIAIKWMSRNKPLDREKLTKNKKSFFDDKLVDWGDSIEELIRKDIVREVEKALSIAPHAEMDVKSISDAWTSQEFSEWMIKSEKSKAYSIFCERLYGKDLCQCSMTTMKQLNKLLAVLSLTNKNKALDLGCGVGTVTEYISDTTGATITGIDIATEAIKWTQRRTKEKQDRLTFETQSMDDLSFPSGSFDTIIVIDTLYFVDNLTATIERCKQLLTSGGQMGVFYSQMIGSGDSKKMLLPDETKLAQALKKCNLIYQTWDYTEDERNFWKQSKKIAEELKADFENEGNIDLYKSRITESDRILETVNDDRSSRYLYHIRKTS